jgi:hypothetical protein
MEVSHGNVTDLALGHEPFVFLLGLEKRKWIFGILRGRNRSIGREHPYKLIFRELG